MPHLFIYQKISFRSLMFCLARRGTTLKVCPVETVVERSQSQTFGRKLKPE